MVNRVALWTVIEPRGIAVTLTEDVWYQHSLKHPEIADYLAEAQQTVQQPDAIYYDALSTTRKQAGISVYAYYRRGITHGEYVGKYVVVSVKFVPEDGMLRGYVQSVMLSDRVMPRLELKWKRSI